MVSLHKIAHILNEKSFSGVIGTINKLPKERIQSLKKLAKNARKYTEDQFVKEYIGILYPVLIGRMRDIKQGEDVQIGLRISRNNYIPHRTVTADQDYFVHSYPSVNSFIVSNFDDFKEYAKSVYQKNKNRPKEPFKSDTKTIIGYHASPNRFSTFRYQDASTSGLKHSNISGFFFFSERKYAKYYADTLTDWHDSVYIYKCKIKSENIKEIQGEETGITGRLSDLSTYENEGYDVVLIRNADTGYGITDEIVVFDDGDIEIMNIVKITNK